MSFIQINNLSFSHPSLEAPLFTNVNLSFSIGWYALIGPNGSGKTTLLNLIYNHLYYDSISITEKETLFFCKQETPKEIPSIFSDPNLINLPQTIKLLGKLDIKDDWPFNWDTLSGGEKKRCMIADSLARNPSILLIDEPANHLDTYSMKLLSRELIKYDKIGIMVSHDLAFLDSICTKTIIIEPNRNTNNVIFYDTFPSQAIIERNKQNDYLTREKNKEINNLNRLKTFRGTQLNKVSASSSRLSKKNLDKKDHSAKAKIDGARLSSKDKKMSKKISNVNNSIVNSQNKINSISVKSKQKTNFKMTTNQINNSILFSLERGQTTLIENILVLNHPYLKINNNSRIIIKGSNGSGKTTFFKYLSKHLKNKGVPFFFLKQDYTREERIELKRKVLSLNKETQGEIFSTIFKLGSNPNSLIQSQSLSPGETQKLLYSIAIIERKPLLILDEPTNYLDVLSISLLIEALNNFNGSIILATHDKYFEQNIKRKEIWNFNKKIDQIFLDIENDNTI